MAVDPNENYLITGEQLEDLGSRVATASAPISSSRIDKSSLAVYEKIYTYTETNDTSQNQTKVIPIAFANYDKIIFDFIGTVPVDSGDCALWTQSSDPGSPQETYQIGFEWLGSSTPTNIFRARTEVACAHFSGVGQGTVDGFVNATFTIPDADGYVTFTCDSISGPNGGLYANRFVGRMKNDTASYVNYLVFDMPAVFAGAEIRVYGIPKNAS